MLSVCPHHRSPTCLREQRCQMSWTPGLNRWATQWSLLPERKETYICHSRDFRFMDTQMMMLLPRVKTQPPLMGTHYFFISSALPLAFFLLSMCPMVVAAKGVWNVGAFHIIWGRGASNCPRSLCFFLGMPRYSFFWRLGWPHCQSVWKKILREFRIEPGTL